MGSLWRGRIERYLWIASAIVLAPAPGTLAQEIPPNVGSADRPRPEYDAIGLRSGAFLIYPDVTLEAIYDDNVYASSGGEVADLTARVSPSIRIESDWNRHHLSLDVRSMSAVHADFSDENVTNFGAAIAGRLDIRSSTALDLRAGFERHHEDRGDIDTPLVNVKPIRYETARAEGSLRHQMNRVSVRLSGEFDRLDYQDALSLAGPVIDQDARDRDELDVGLRGEYEFSPGYKGVVQISSNVKDYDLGPNSALFNPSADLDRDSRGVRVEAGLAFELSRLLYGDVRVGYLSQNYRDPNILDVKGLSFGAGLLWNVTELTSVRIRLDRRAEDTTSTISAGRMTTDAGVGVNHEFLRNLIVTLEGSYSDYSYRGVALSGDYLSAGARVRYLLNQHVAAEIAYQFATQDFAAALPDYTRNAVRIGFSVYP